LDFFLFAVVASKFFASVQMSLLTLMLGVCHTTVPPSSTLQTGDLVFVSPPLDRAVPIDAAILETGAATIAWLRDTAKVPVRSNSTATHVALAQRNASGLYFVEAIPPVVTVTAEREFWERESPGTRWHRGVLRAVNVSVKAAAVAIASAQLGKPYATLFEPPSSGEFYCSSLAEYAYRAALATPHVFVDQRFTLIFEPLAFWVKYYAAMGEKLPVNASGSNPTLLLHSPAVAASDVGPSREVHK